MILTFKFAHKIKYPTIGMMLLSFCCFFFTFTEYNRVFENYREYYLILKISIGLITFILAVLSFYLKPNDILSASMMICCVVYCLCSSWFAPFYEFAYLQTCIGCAFFQTRRRWIFTTVFGFGLAGFLLTYYVQDKIGWDLPPVSRIDYVYSMIVIFILSLLIRQFALKFRYKEDIYNIRMMQIGKESTRVLHDIKGMLSIPRFRIERMLQNQEPTKNELMKELEELETELTNVSKTLKQMNRLILNDSEKNQVALSTVLDQALDMLKYRLADIHIELDASLGKKINIDIDRLRSIFFNLLINSIDAFEKNNLKSKNIRINFEKKLIIYEDTAGGFTQNVRNDEFFKENSSLGLSLIQYDLEQIGAELSIRKTKLGSRFEMKFKNYLQG
jgi:signal transduction histidine kinase